MKKLFTLLFLSLMVFITRANQNDGKITITQLGIQKLRIEIDGRSFNNNNNQFLLITNMVPGTHAITIYSQYQQNNINKGGSYSWGERVIYTARIRIQPRHHIDIVVNRFGKTLVDDQMMDDRYNEQYADDSYYDNDRRDRKDYDQRNNVNRDRYDNRNNDRNTVRPMADQPFTSLLETLKNETFENTRLNLAKQVGDQNYFTTVQVKQVLQLFTFENSRLDLAKYLYKNTVDKEVYFQLYDVFTYSQSKDALSSYTRDFK
jgi:Domain of unknown function (DUF4476)